jgi:hypothetical protein
MFVYLIVNDVNLKIYVGKTTNRNLKQYLQSKISDALGRRYHGRSHLLAAIRKYGRDHFHIHPLFEGQTNKEICEQEKILIKALGVQHSDIGYNICRGGEGFTGLHSEESKKKNIENSLQTWQDPEIRERRITNQRKAREERGGSFLTDESVEKIKAARAEQDESVRIKAVQKWAAEHPEEMSTCMSREVHVLGGKAGSHEAKRRAGLLGAKAGSVKARHVRWHVNRGKPNPGCSLCTTSSFLF